MNPLVTYVICTFLAAICAFLKIFYKTNEYLYFIIIGVVLSIIEFIFRIPTKSLGLGVLNLSVSSMQIIWVASNLLISSILSVLMFGDVISLNKIIGMFMILLGLWFGSLG